ncbi:FCD domain-containing protein [Nocardioides sp. LMS-CY]|uniref:DNA-binding FadR family transcriptional regulator n=1 Tax=Nocardioides soli TaxID=1036020 RepID=A0A7W4Z5C7_9ACTN|nr:MULTISPECIES: FCD domain-containing protein [Nocardioides]MBB3045665.1 DNA-binding FadR family transcriptional regulator [Nocardioides soli]QWF22143.1 FCD domain-containing protein [Nocardioides sp. LMS-CY]
MWKEAGINPQSGRSPASNVRFARLAEQVADDLRSRLLVGDLVDATELPIEESLRSQYGVSKPTFREAMRVLEAEGLITIRRGAIGGAVVHRLEAEHVAYTLGMALAGRGVDISDVAQALQEVEPACAAACALRADRAQVVVPVLTELHEQAVAVVDNLVAVTTLSRKFHEAIVDLCGNQSLSMLAGALESLWSSHESAWANRRPEGLDIPPSERLDVLGEHRRLIDSIADGDADAARSLALRHLISSQNYPTAEWPEVLISPASVRARFIETSTGSPG